MNDTLILHKCIEENQVFFIDFLITKIIQNLSPKRLKKFLTQKDANNNNVFHLTCEKRIKFLVEEIWNLTLKAFDADSSELEKFLLNQNIDEKNAFVHAFQMPLTYNKSDYANEIKNRNGLFNYYRNPGPLELEMYNFESCLNLIYDIARKNISDKNKKKLIVGKNLKTIKTRQHYNYSKEFSDFRYDFLQIRFYCITRISSIKSDNLDSVARVYQFLSHYVDQYIYINCNNEVDLIN
ncbi:hypothetical protein PVAND_008800 [Polypedilum vanderplanki]|nr:hypothetical protein PVAND_008800 [Polypedilum vanderplanki]